MRMHIETIPHKAQTYDTVGNWQIVNNDIYIQVSEMDNEDYSFLVGIHEAIEVWLCKKRNITTYQVDIFDKEFEVARKSASKLATEFIFRDRMVEINAEPGDQKDSPYYREHQFARNIECMVAYELGIDLDDYEKAVDSLS